MANVMAPKGLVPVRHLNGSPWNGQTVPFLMTGATGATFIGDIVDHGGTSGAAGVVVGGVDCEGMATCIPMASGVAGQGTLGVVVGFSVLPQNLMMKHRETSTDRIAYVVTDTTVVYEAQEDALGTPIAAASIGLAFSLVLGAGNTTTGVSGFVLDSSQTANTATFPLKLLGLSKKTNNRLNVDGAGVDAGVFDVVFNTGYFMPNIAGA